ncbi:endonuclease/exonuclease/phosphatase family protein [Psychroserpens sp. Hel_I_66]|uniref:endonuclease/exonuclease/phosphatase family protein n=1 Tax=Psychroserpens sp. Hel_I_66 TaxID=1250004 RepID=UPI000648D9EE|nr:endonuclease/exonuclease/phosphatase family protein [Psychroserpens sp. Hel_I_66]
MIKKLFLFVLLFVFCSTSGFAQADFKLMFYNLLNFPLEDAVPDRLASLEFILDDYRPDIFMVCELNNEEGANTILSSLQTINPDYVSATFELNTSDDNLSNQNDLQQLIYYDSTKFILESQAIVTTIFRDFNHYKLKINSVEQETAPIVIDFFVCHLKASSGSENQASRLEMIEDLVIYLDDFPEDSNVVLAGDFNIYTDSELAFQRLIDPSNNITFIDPANRIGSWHNNPSFVDVMTQSTRTQTGLGGTTGGFDDRFDFIMTSENLSTNPDLSFISGSYDVYGNNENTNCYNQSINSTNCAGSDFSFAIRDALHNFSDHLPVILELQTNQSLSIPEFTAPKLLTILGSNVIDNTLKLEANLSLQNDLELIIFNSLGQVIKTVDVNNTLISLDVTQISSGIYYITSSRFQFKPLKFLVAH